MKIGWQTPFSFTVEDPQINLHSVLALYIMLSWFSRQRLLRLSKAYIPFTWVNLFTNHWYVLSPKIYSNHWQIDWQCQGHFWGRIFQQRKRQIQIQKKRKGMLKKRYFYPKLATQAVGNYCFPFWFGYLCEMKNILASIETLRQEPFLKLD